MTDTPTKRKRFGSGICWEYMDKGLCLCDKLNTPSEWHPKITITSTTNSSGKIVIVASMQKRIPEWIESLKYIGFIEGDPNNFAILHASYEEREEVKTLGASFAPGLKKWIVVQGEDLAPFAKWHPCINNRSVGEVVLNNSTINMASTVRELQRCGVKPAHIDVKGSDSEAVIVRNCLSSLTKQKKVDTEQQAAPTKKMRLELNEHAQSTVNDNIYASSYAVRPQFSSPEVLQNFVKRKQEEQIAERQFPLVQKKHQNELDTLLSTAKSALVCCNSSGRISTEQKQYNEAIYNIMEALTAKVDSSTADKQPHTASSAGTPPSPSRVDQSQNMVTPMQKMG